MREYFNDFLATILLFAFIQILLSIFLNRILSIRVVILTTIFASIVWEYVAPFYKLSAEFRYLDFVAYGLGSVLYMLLLKWFKSKEIMTSE
ncbi:MAG: hypothetical protein QM489_02175 [Candidatus Izemoplasma sp.]